MLGVIHIPPLDRVVVNVLQLLPHHGLAEHQLRVGARLPELMVAIALINGFCLVQPLQQGGGPVAGQKLDEFHRREGLETGDALVQPRRLGDQVQVVFEHDVAIEAEVAMLSQVGPTVEKYLYGFGPGEDRQPLDHGAGEKVRGIGLGDDVTAATHGTCSNAAFLGCPCPRPRPHLLPRPHAPRGDEPHGAPAPRSR